MLGVVLLLVLLNAAVTPSSQEQNNSLYAASQSVLGDDEDNEDEKSGEESQKEAEKAREEQQKAAERKEEEAKQTNTPQGPSGSSGSIKMKTKSEGNKRETEIETADGQKIKTKVEDDGTTKIEIEHNKLKIKYEVRNGQVIRAAEDEDGEEVELDDDELDELEDEMEEELEDDGIKIATGSAGQLTFAKNNIAATTNFPLTIDVRTNQLIVTTPAGQKVVAVLPDQAVRNLLATGVINEIDSTGGGTAVPNELGSVSSVVEFKIRNDEPVYEVNGQKTYRLFAVFPVSRPITAVVSAETGDVVGTEKSFLTNIIDLLSP